jgi:acetylglutamate kinase|tara:strand:- start:3841 stop:4614 length:774 start_codon:yes stop_codon:yes gene_type:complete
MDKVQIVKIGGNIIENRKDLHVFLSDFSKIKGPKILVHGGGKEVTQMATKINVPVKIIDGRRVTNLENLEIITMLYAGKINKTIVAQLQALNCNSLGLTGADGNSIVAEKRSPNPIDYGFVGDVVSVNASFFTNLLHQGITPVNCAITHNKKGQLLNTNADTIAAKIAASLASNFEVTLSYCFEKKGVLEDIKNEKSVLPSINKVLYVSLKNTGVIHSGMLPKLHNCFEALQKGVQQVRIGNQKMITETKNYTQIQL